MKYFSKYLDSTFHEVTKIQASDTKHMQIIIRVYHKEQKPSAMKNKIFNKENNNLENNASPFNS